MVSSSTCTGCIAASKRRVSASVVAPRASHHVATRLTGSATASGTLRWFLLRRRLPIRAGMSCRDDTNVSRRLAGAPAVVRPLATEVGIRQCAQELVEAGPGLVKTCPDLGAPGL